MVATEASVSRGRLMRKRRARARAAGAGAGAAAESGLTKRKKVHEGGGDEFKHLVNYDMNELCARVVVIGRKPL